MSNVTFGESEWVRQSLLLIVVNGRGVRRVLACARQYNGNAMTAGCHKLVICKVYSLRTVLG